MKIKSTVKIPQSKSSQKKIKPKKKNLKDKEEPICR